MLHIVHPYQAPSGDAIVTAKETLFFITFDSSEREKDFQFFLLTESSLLYFMFSMFSLCVVTAASFRNFEAYNTMFLVMISLIRLVALVNAILYGVYLAQHKNMVPRSSWFLEKFDPSLMASFFIISSISNNFFHVVASLHVYNDDRSIDQDGLYFILFLLLKLCYLKIIFRAARWWAVILMGVIGFAGIFTGIFIHHFQLPNNIAFLIVVFAVLGFISTIEYDKLTIRWYLKTINMQAITREAVEKESEKKKMLMITRELRSFVGNVAHDIKTPLQSIMDNVDQVKDAGDLERAAVVPSIQGNCKLIIMMLNRSLDFSKVESGVMLVRSTTSLNISKMLKGVVDCTLAVSDTVKLITPEIEESICQFIVTDKSWVEENLLCLTMNAMRFTTNGVVDITVALASASDIDNEAMDISSTRATTIATAAEGACTGDQALGISPFSISAASHAPPLNQSYPFVVFKVHNSGPSLTDDQMADVFKRPVQSSRLSGGGGLGLYVLTKRCEAMGGSYGVGTRVDGQIGTRFWFSIPYIPDPAVAERVSSLERASIAKKKSSTISIQDNPKLSPIASVLLVDDSVLIQKTTARVLRREGWHVSIANHGGECLAALDAAEHPFDIVLLDMQMPVMVSNLSMLLNRIKVVVSLLI
jgi:signal transduction histidine kinase